MVIIKENYPHLYIVGSHSIITYNFEDNKTNETKLSQDSEVSSMCISKNSQLIAVTLQNKQVVIYDTDFKIIDTVLAKRTVSSTRFTNDYTCILIADKTGDLFVYKLGSKSQPELLLGHLSILLDVTLSDCGKYVITCDRDEKIRISCYPNSYNIISYCLGHREFVTNLEIYGNILLSASGDGTIRFWNFLEGKEMLMVDCNEYVEDKSIIEKFCKQMDGENVDAVALPITDMQVFRGEVTIIAVTLLEFTGVQLYTMDTSKEQLNARFLQSVMVPTQVNAFSLGRKLLILTDDRLCTYQYEKNKVVEADSNQTSELYNNYKNALKPTFNNSYISALYKRKYDNVQEYLERKRLRIENKS